MELTVLCGRVGEILLAQSDTSELQCGLTGSSKGERRKITPSSVSSDKRRGLSFLLMFLFLLHQISVLCFPRSVVLLFSVSADLCSCYMLLIDLTQPQSSTEALPRNAKTTVIHRSRKHFYIGFWIYFGTAVCVMPRGFELHVAGSRRRKIPTAVIVYQSSDSVWKAFIAFCMCVQSTNVERVTV